MNYTENIKIAFRSIKDNFLRSFLTLLIIAVGITCLVGILTAIDSVLNTMSDNFTRIGANSFSFRRASETLRSNNRGKTVKRAEAIVFDQAMDFKDRYKFSGAVVSVDAYATGNAKVVYGTEETNPTIQIRGIDENYFITSSYEVDQGRNFSPSEVYSGGNLAVIGKGLVDQLFDKKAAKAIGKDISVSGAKYRIVGTLKEKGSAGGSGGGDKGVYIPLMNAKKLYGHSKKNYNVIVALKNPKNMEDAISQSIGVMRNVRGLKAADTNDFEIRKSDGVLEQLKEMTSKLRIATLVIATLTLLGAAIGLMNIMLVSVTERTKEIGVRKALGATSKNVLQQFLTEAVTICILGGILGIILGILIGLVVTLAMKGSFVVPWNWMGLGIAVCVVVGIVSGLYPAMKAAKLDPIESLRYE